MLHSIKRLFLILTIVFTVLIMLVSCLSYTGLLRLCKLKIFSCNKVFNKKLPKINEKIHVIITPKQNIICNSRLRQVINSILDQEIQIDSITIMLQESANNYEIPKEFEKYIKVQYINDSYCKEYRGFIQGLLQTIDANSYIFHIDDQTIYGKDYILNSISRMKDNSNIVLIGKQNNIVCKPDHFCFERDFRKLNKHNITSFLQDDIQMNDIKYYEYIFSV